MVRTLTNDSSLGWPLAAGVAAGAVASALTFPARGRRFVQQVLVVCGLSSGVMTYYAARGVDDYQWIYLGIFYGSVLLLGWSLIAMRVALLARSPAWRIATGLVAAGVAVWAGATGNFTNPYVGVPDAPQLAETIANDPRWETGPPILTIDGDGWAEAATLLIELERRGKRPWLIQPQHHVLFTDAYRPDDRPLSGLWQLDAAEAKSPAIPARRVLAQFPYATIRELETRCPFGGPIPIAGRGRLPGAKPIDGWSLSDDDRLIPIRDRAVMLIDLDPCPAREVRLTMRASSVLAPNPAGQRVRVTVNGQPVGEVAFPTGPDTERSLVFAGEVLNRRTPVRIDFAFPDVDNPSGESGPRARLRFSIVMSALSLTPAGP
jgi:hypothetical protein